MSVIDYSKWNNISDSSDEDDDEDREHSTRSMCTPHEAMYLKYAKEYTNYHGEVFNPDDPEQVKKMLKFMDWIVLKEKSKFVKIHPQDNCDGLAEVFLTDPAKFVPPDDGLDCSIHYWGLPDMRDNDLVMLMNRKMRIQMLYRDEAGDFTSTPEVQFVRELLKHREEHLNKRKLDPVINKNLKRDYILSIKLVDIEPVVWRCFKVSGGLTLSIIQDKVVSPIMGWTRNYHAHYFTCLNDGTMFGSTNSDAIDMCWLDNHGYQWIDDRNWNLGLILLEPGERLSYVYDLGDRWEHEIKVEKILSLEQSDGKCVILDGGMSCPPEDSNGCDGKGNNAYQSFLGSLPSKKQWKGPRAKNISKKLKKKLREAGNSLNVMKFYFDPYYFDIKESNAELKSALDSVGSARLGSKKFIHPFGADGPDISQRNELGKEVTRTPVFGNSYLEETIKTDRDKKRDAVCNNCGSPNDLHVCADCRMVRYCGRTCQKEHWQMKHKAECDSLRVQHDKLKLQNKKTNRRAKTPRKHSSNGS